MSVTFAAQSDRQVTSYTVKCYCDESVGIVMNSAAEIEALFTNWDSSPVLFENCKTVEVCVQCRPIVKENNGTENIPMSNFANTNAAEILTTLGYEVSPDLCGYDSAESFLGRVLIADAVLPVSAERLTEVSKVEGQATMVYCGREEGYMQNVLDELRTLAELAAEGDFVISWG